MIPVDLLTGAKTWISHQRTLLEICQEQQALIRDLRAQAEQDDLMHVRFQRDLMVKFRDAIGEPDIEDVMETLEWAISDLSDHVARLEEHLV